MIPDWGINNLRVFATVVNAFTITKYKGYNPEVDYNYSSGGSNSTQPTNLAPGVDYGVYPLGAFLQPGRKGYFLINHLNEFEDEKKDINHQLFSSNIANSGFMQKRFS